MFPKKRKYSAGRDSTVPGSKPPALDQPEFPPAFEHVVLGPRGSRGSGGPRDDESNGQNMRQSKRDMMLCGGQFSLFGHVACTHFPGTCCNGFNVLVLQRGINSVIFFLDTSADMPRIDNLVKNIALWSRGNLDQKSASMKAGAVGLDLIRLFTRQMSRRGHEHGHQKARKIEGCFVGINQTSRGKGRR